MKKIVLMLCFGIISICGISSGSCLMDVTGVLDGMCPPFQVCWEPGYQGVFDAPNGYVDGYDLGAMANLLIYEGTNYVVTVYPEIEAFDVTGTLDGMEFDSDWNLIYTGNFDAPNGYVDGYDLAALANFLVNEGTYYVYTCPE